MKVLLPFLVFVAQLSGCAAPLCPFSLAEPPLRAVGVRLPGIEDIAPLSENDFIIAAHPADAPLGIDVMTVISGREELIGSTPPLFPYDLTYLFSSGERWWFTRQGEEAGESSVYFVEGGDRVQRTRVALPRQHSLVWLPLRGREPRGLLISVADEQPALRIQEVTPSGVTAIAEVPWWEAGFHRTVARSQWSAEALDDGRFAVVAVDGPEEAMTLRLRIIGDGETSESEIPCPVQIDYPLATAVNDAGRLAVVGRSAKGEVVAILTDVDRSGSARCRVISERGEVAAEPPFGSPSVVATGADFVAAWIRDDGAVRASELKELRVDPVVVMVGEGADLERPLRQLVFADADYLTFFWKERHGGITTRRMPARLTGLAFAQQIERVLCPIFHQ